MNKYFVGFDLGTKDHTAITIIRNAFPKNLMYTIDNISHQTNMKKGRKISIGILCTVFFFLAGTGAHAIYTEVANCHNQLDSFPDKGSSPFICIGHF